ncbi:unnamed protein product, partial [Discosporangium mesarthrocarpum]
LSPGGSLYQPHPLQSCSRRERVKEQPRHRQGKHYLVVNRTDRPVWYGQALTTETLLLGPCEETPYSWRNVPVPGMARMTKELVPSRLCLCLRFSLHHDPQQLPGIGGGADEDCEGRMGAWTEPVAVDEPGTCKRLLWMAGAMGRDEGLGSQQASQMGTGVVLPLWVVVVKEGLQSRIELYGEWSFTNHLPRRVQVTWSVAISPSDSLRRQSDPLGTRGTLKLGPSGKNQADDQRGGGRLASRFDQRSRASETSALSACLGPGNAASGEGWTSELMLEFRVRALNNRSVAVGSIGPPPVATQGFNDEGIGHGARGGRGGAGRRGATTGTGVRTEQVPGLGEAHVLGERTWSMTRQSEWVEASPGAYISLIACASADPGVTSLWFWCVAEREWVLLADCEACRSGVGGHQRHPGRMSIKLHPLALVTNRCTQSLTAWLGVDGGAGGSAGGGG